MELALLRSVDTSHNEVFSYVHCKYVGPNVELSHIRVIVSIEHGLGT